jgi:hypothetical protein
MAEKSMTNLHHLVEQVIPTALLPHRSILPTNKKLYAEIQKNSQMDRIADPVFINWRIDYGDVEAKYDL